MRSIDDHRDGIEQTRHETSDENVTQGPIGCSVKLAWVAFGPLGLVVYVLYLAQELPHPMSGQSLGFWGVVGFVLAARYADLAWCGGDTPPGEAPTNEHFVRYAAGLFGLSGLAWYWAILM